MLVEHIFSLGRIIRERLSTDSSYEPLLHLAILKFVSERQPRMREIADYLRITPPSATSVVNALAESGQIKRIKDRSDRRTVRLSITARGEKSLDDGMRQKRSAIGSIINRLSKNEQDDLKKILGKLIGVSA